MHVDKQLEVIAQATHQEMIARMMDLLRIHFVVSGVILI